MKMEAYKKRLGEIVPHDGGMNEDLDKPRHLSYGSGYIDGFRAGWEAALDSAVPNIRRFLRESESI